MIYRRTFLTVIAAMLLVVGHSHAQDNEELRELVQEAQAAVQSEDWEKAVELYTKANELRPDTPFVEFNLGYSLHASGKLDEAIKFHKKAAKSNQYKQTALYNLACAYSIKKDADKAFDNLEKSIKAGFLNTRQLEDDPDFKNVKDDSRFADMIVLMKNGGKMPVKISAETFYGSWTLTSGSRAGSKVAAESLPEIKIDEKHFTIPSGPGAEPFVMSYKMMLDKKPIAVDFDIESGPISEGKAKGIVKVGDDGRMVLCYKPDAKEHPSDFISTKENGYYVFKMKKAAETKDDKGSDAKSKGDDSDEKVSSGGSNVKKEAAGSAKKAAAGSDKK